jgi:rhamnosyltransferase
VTLFNLSGALLLTSDLIKKSKPTVLVLLASYNGARWIEAQVASILNQVDVDVSIIISDDNSKDCSRKILEKLDRANDNINVVFHENGSGSAGQNFIWLITHSDFTGFDYVAFSDQDDVWYPEKLACGIGKLADDFESGYSSSVNACWPNGKNKILTQSNILRSADFLFEGAGQGCTFILGHKLVTRVQVFCTANQELVAKFYYHDWLVYLLTRSWGLAWVFDDRAFMSYLQHGSNDTGARGSFGAVSARLKLISEGWYKEQINVALNIWSFTGHRSLLIKKFSLVFLSHNSIGRKIKLFVFILKYGRRKSIDRVVMAISALLGWI